MYLIAGLEGGRDQARVLWEAGFPASPGVDNNTAIPETRPTVDEESAAGGRKVKVQRHELKDGIRKKMMARRKYTKGTSVNGVYKAKNGEGKIEIRHRHEPLMPQDNSSRQVNLKRTRSMKMKKEGGTNRVLPLKTKDRDSTQQKQTVTLGDTNAEGQEGDNVDGEEYDVYEDTGEGSDYIETPAEGSDDNETAGNEGEGVEGGTEGDSGTEGQAGDGGDAEEYDAYEDTGTEEGNDNDGATGDEGEGIDGGTEEGDSGTEGQAGETAGGVVEEEFENQDATGDAIDQVTGETDVEFVTVFVEGEGKIFVR
ncbi:spore wall protein 2-like [Homarus americanus]|uniref:spore wall protein 2-like n=1 Tax=Homarus americanus TaxID=6706 RepID=UPI001C46A278|nr:spore wall protein 2-like [Homarus americanus]